MIAKAGYDTETHIVTTADCYILEMHRIPRGRDGNKAVKQRRPPILLQHGLLSSSADFVMNGPGKALGTVFLRYFSSCSTKKVHPVHEIFCKSP